MIDVKNVTKSFGSFKALDDVTMHINNGSVYGLIGPNGAGKSTILRHITGIFRPDSGTISLDGQPIYENKAIKEHIVYIPDDLFFFPQANTLEMKEFYKGLYPGFDPLTFEKLSEAFSTIPLKKPIRRLSKGMQKQVMFWISISCKPDVLVLDEPVDGLDPVMRRQVWSILLSESAEREMTVLVSSHNLRELEDVCDTVGIMHRGRILLERTLDDLQGSISKYQVVYPDEKPIMPAGLDILNTSQTGHAYTLIIRGNQEEVRLALNSTHPAVLDILPLSLEEIFIYEMGDMNYEFKDILY